MSTNTVKLRTRPRSRQSGWVLVECVFGVIVLCTFIFGVVEVAAIFKESSTMYNLARDCARDLAAGKQYTGTVSKVVTAANSTGHLSSNLTTGAFTVLWTDSADGSSFPSGNVVKNDGATFAGNSNNIPQGDLFRVDLAYTHQRFTSLLWNSNKTMHAMVIMRRQ